MFVHSVWYALSLAGVRKVASKKWCEDFASLMGLEWGCGRMNRTTVDCDGDIEFGVVRWVWMLRGGVMSDRCMVNFLRRQDAKRDDGALNATVNRDGPRMRSRRMCRAGTSVLSSRTHRVPTPLQRHQRLVLGDLRRDGILLPVHVILVLLLVLQRRWRLSREHRRRMHRSP